MKTVDISIGATCVVECPDDNQWYRAVIKSMPTLNILNVYYVDHGGRQNVPRNNVYYVKSEFHDFPATAFEAQLANLKPSNNESSWNNQSQRRFIELCESPVIMAYLIPSENGTYSVYLCDTRGETDIHLNDTLVKEGFAEFCIQNQHSENNNFPYENFDFEEPLNWDEKIFLRELDALCLFILKAKHEALKVKRLKLLRTDSAIALEERKRIEKFQSIVEKRIKQIKEICNQSMKQTEEICTQIPAEDGNINLAK